MNYLTVDYYKEIDKIAQWMRAYSTQISKTKGYVVGLSGGIDSSVIACLAVMAMGKENVIGVMMPCDSTNDTVSDAKKLAKNLGIKNVMMGLYPTFEQFTNDLTTKVGTDCPEEYPDIDLSGIAQGNIKARLRMTALYAIAEANGYLVAGTGNLSELMIGYCTKFGDGGVDIEPIGNYYKTEVYKMAECLPEIPQGSKTKAPSAGLEEGQTDEQDIGMTYKELDSMLIHIEDRCVSKLDPEYIKVKKMIDGAIHKNEAAPRYDR